MPTEGTTTVNDDFPGVRVLVPARSGSKSIPGKNLRKVGNFTLLEYAIAAARAIFPRDQVWVSTDSAEYAEVAKRAGATVPFLRPAALSTDVSTDYQVFRHAMEWERSTCNETRVWLHLRPTTPDRNPETVRDALTTFMANQEVATSLRSAHPVPQVPQKWGTRDSDGYFRTLCNSKAADLMNQPRQNYPQVFQPNGYVDVIGTSTIAQGNLHGNACLLYQTEASTDIDRLVDLEQVALKQTNLEALSSWLQTYRERSAT